MVAFKYDYINPQYPGVPEIMKVPPIAPPPEAPHCALEPSRRSFFRPSDASGSLDQTGSVARACASRGPTPGPLIGQVRLIRRCAGVLQGERRRHPVHRPRTRARPHGPSEAARSSLGDHHQGHRGNEP